MQNLHAPPRVAPSRWLSKAAWVNAVFLAALWILESRVGEAHWLSGAICYLPQHLVVVPTLLLLLLSLRARKRRLTAIFAATLLYATHLFLGVQVPASTWSRDPSPPTRRLRAMTYNILGAQRGVENVAAAIRAQNPDVLFLQEAIVERPGDPDPVTALRPHLPGYSEAREGEVCILSRFPVLAMRKTQFPNGAARFVVQAILDVDGVPVRAIVVHPYSIQYRSKKFTIPQRLSRSLATRGGQIRTLLRAIDSPPSTWRREWREAPLLVAGDFNTPPRGRIYNALSARLTDSWREAGWGAGNTYSSTLPVIRIDYVWHSRQWRATRAREVSSRASDHKALVVDLELR